MAALGLCLFTARAAQAQEPPPVVPPTPVAPPMRVVVVEEAPPDFDNRISFNPLGLLFGFGSFMYQRHLTDRLSLDITPSFIYFGFGDDKIWGGSVAAGVSFFISGRAPRGLNVRLGVEGGFVDATGADAVMLFGARFLFGYNWVWQSGFSLGLSGGAQYAYFDLGNDVDTSLDGILPAVDFNLGFMF